MSTLQGEHMLIRQTGDTMKFDRSTGLLFAGFILAISGAAADDTLHTGDSSTMGKWYGRAGGLVGADRIEAQSSVRGSQIGITYDKDVAQRTNMQPRDTSGAGVGITYDKDVAARTNMPRDEKAQQPIQSVGAAGEAAKN
jgi:hypothetical protein